MLYRLNHHMQESKFDAFSLNDLFNLLLFLGGGLSFAVFSSSFINDKGGTGNMGSDEP